MKTYLVCNSDDNFKRIDIFLCDGKYYWSYHNEGYVYGTKLNNSLCTHIGVIKGLCKDYKWKFIGEVE